MKNNNLSLGMQSFNFNGTEIRSATLNGEPALVLKDICEVLGVDNYRDVAARLDEDEKGVDTIDTHGGRQEMIIINEAGFYNAVLLSRKPVAKEFRRWATHEVFPTIRKHGAYITPTKLEDIMNDPDAWITMLTALKDERANNKILADTIKEIKPKAALQDGFFETNNGLLTSAVAKLYGMSATWLNVILQSYGVLMQRNHEWVLTETYADKGYVTQNKMVRKYFVWTPEGVSFVKDVLAQHGIIPLAERSATCE